MGEWNKIHKKLDAYKISKKTKFLEENFNKLRVNKIE